jgi:hypothetical protein
MLLTGDEAMIKFRDTDFMMEDDLAFAKTAGGQRGFDKLLLTAGGLYLSDI